MSGTHAGGKKANLKISKAKRQEIGRKGGLVKTKKGFAVRTDLASAAGRKGGLTAASKRWGKDYTYKLKILDR